VLGLSSEAVGLAERLLKEIRGKKVYSIKKTHLAIYAASILRGEYVPLSVLVQDKQIAPAIIRIDMKRLFGVDVDAVRMAEIEARGWCRILQLDPLLCEATACIVVEIVKSGDIRLDYTKLAVLVLRYVMKRLGITMRIPSNIVSQHFRHRLAIYRKRAVKYLGMCLDRARAVAMQLQ
jgi:hypothetical protein